VARCADTCFNSHAVEGIPVSARRTSTSGTVNRPPSPDPGTDPAAGASSALHKQNCDVILIEPWIYQRFEIRHSPYRIVTHGVTQTALGIVSGNRVGQSICEYEKESTTGNESCTSFILRVFWFSVKLRREESAEGEIPPCGRGFSRHEDLSSDLLWAA